MWDSKHGAYEARGVNEIKDFTPGSLWKDVRLVYRVRHVVQDSIYVTVLNMDSRNESYPFSNCRFDERLTEAQFNDMLLADEVP
jgi:hypothetical protein